MEKPIIQKNKIYHDDCYKLIKEIPDNSIDLIVTDPPYKFENQGWGFYAKNKSTQRTYLDSLKKLGCCDFEPEEFLNNLKPKRIKRLLWWLKARLLERTKIYCRAF